MKDFIKIVIPLDKMRKYNKLHEEVRNRIKKNSLAYIIMLIERSDLI